ncbi:DUF6191 domain-containing protein [Kitasatospora sp. DSM 101779]|uniref:DUF6191 domain-containing protein n=1 Tax=Kitasatospora sp. DSM 101779 TaxID=2853165 RepID=UPI0029557F6B|nr:DUF6191 domain-containing protein [Kitasatospora sp. DSM 101779]
MAIFWAMSLPGLVCALVALAVLDQLALHARRAGRLPWRGAGREGQVSATGFEQLHAQFAAGKQHELKQRATTLMLRDEEGDGAPPRGGLDLRRGTAVLSPRPGAAGPRQEPSRQSGTRRAGLDAVAARSEAGYRCVSSAAGRSVGPTAP